MATSITPTLRVSSTTKPRYQVGPKRIAKPAPALFLPPDDPRLTLVADTIAAAGRTRSMRKKDTKRGRVGFLRTFMFLLHDLKHIDGATPGELEGVLVAILNAARSIIHADRPRVSSDDVKLLARREQEIENRGNLAGFDALDHLSDGTLRQLRAATMEEVDAELQLVAAIDARLMQREG